MYKIKKNTKPLKKAISNNALHPEKEIINLTNMKSRATFQIVRCAFSVF